MRPADYPGRTVHQDSKIWHDKRLYAPQKALLVFERTGYSWFGSWHMLLCEKKGKFYKIMCFAALAFARRDKSPKKHRRALLQGITDADMCLRAAADVPEAAK